MTNHRVYFLLCYLTTLVISKPLEDDSLPHSRDYYAGYIKAITDNFDQLFATERKTRSTEDEKVCKVPCKSYTFLQKFLLIIEDNAASQYSRIFRFYKKHESSFLHTIFDFTEVNYA